VSALKSEISPAELSHVIITHVGPNRIPTLKLLLEAALAGRPADKPLKIVVSNPAQAALQKGLAGKGEGSQPTLVACVALMCVVLCQFLPAAAE
jgi:flavorubredoxin